MTSEVWHKILHFQTLDLVERVYKSKHGKSPSKKRISEITSNFIQAREYFASAEKADFSVQPLLLYYGVVGLSRGLILIESGLSEAALKPAHGINTLDWSQTLSKGLVGIRELKIQLCNGTFWELLKATKNKSYLKANSTVVNWRVSYVLPIENTELKFKDLVSVFPDVLEEYKTWMIEEKTFIPFQNYAIEENIATFTVLKNNVLTLEKIQSVMPDIIIIKEENDKYVIKLLKKNNLYYVQRFNGWLNIGDVYISLPISEKTFLASIPSLYCVAYYLGMLVRYFPSIWTSLGRPSEGDSIFPLINKLLELVRYKYPEAILEFLKGPYSFEK